MKSTRSPLPVLFSELNTAYTSSPNTVIFYDRLLGRQKQDRMRKDTGFYNRLDNLLCQRY